MPLNPFYEDDVINAFITPKHSLYRFHGATEHSVWTLPSALSLEWSQDIPVNLVTTLHSVYVPEGSADVELALSNLAMT
ncbi:hypothetical protein JCM33374_g1954 [Metschnikowia sp. JCM 33374]|nr:hypothetical protein JCM33374_g1954 [Metschnikowia sp. JCM 33374]